MRFNELELSTALMQGIDEASFVECTPVQEQTFQQVLTDGHDVTVQSQTGTGKTAAFLVSIFEIFTRSADEGGKTSHRALIVVPTRELAVQVEEEAKLLGAHLPFIIGSLFGGVGYNQQEHLLQQHAEVIIGTPGRLLDFVSSRKLDLRQFDILVLDEADRMLDMGFLPDVRKILRALPPATERRTMLFSATLSIRVKHLAWEFMNEPAEIEVAPERVTVEEISQELYHVSTKEKMKLLLGLLKRENPDNALIFTNMKSTAVQIAKRLTHNGMPAEFIMGDLPQRKRQSLINGIKDGRIKFLVATDVAARGLHIDDLDLVVNYDIPEDPELYVHRIGRTARAGKTGKAISLACERYVYGLPAIETFIGQKIPTVWADDTLYEDDSSAGMRFSDREVERRDDRRRTGERSGGGRSGGYAQRGGDRGRSQSGGRRPSVPRPADGARAAQARPADDAAAAEVPAAVNGAARTGPGSRGPRGNGAPAQGSGLPRSGARPPQPKREGPSRTDGRAQGDGRAQAGSRTQADGRAQADGPSRKDGRAQAEVRSRTEGRAQSGGRSQAGPRPAANAPLEDRVSYYRKKYGDDFAVDRGGYSAQTKGTGGKGRNDRAEKPAREPGPKPPKAPKAAPVQPPKAAGQSSRQSEPAKPGLISKLKGFFKHR